MEPNQQQETSKFLVPVAIVIAGALIAGAIYAGGGTGAPVADDQKPATEAKVVAVSDKDHILGPRNAEVIVVEYSDTECPFCKVFHNTMHQVVTGYNGRVAWVYRHLPIPQLHTRATREAEATECVAELGGNQAFWQYLDKLFATTNSNDSLDPAQLPIMAVSVGIDETAFNECLSSGRHVETVKKSVDEAYAAGARGTPHSFIMTKNGPVNIINGAEPIANVKAKIDAVLK